MRNQPDRCEMVLWKLGRWQCEFWVISDRTVIRLREGDELLHQRVVKGSPAAMQLAETWRAAIPQEGAPH
jgi:hypothetical protein